MELIINHQSTTFDVDALHVAELIAHYYKDNTAGLAVAVNHKVIPKNEWENFPLKNGDHILIITATQGG